MAGRRRDYSWFEWVALIVLTLGTIAAFAYNTFGGTMGHFTYGALVASLIAIAITGAVRQVNKVNQRTSDALASRVTRAEEELSKPIDLGWSDVTLKNFKCDPAVSRIPSEQWQNLLRTSVASSSRIKPAWDLSRGTLEEYWQRNLQQNSQIFVLSVSAIIVGFITTLAAIGVSFTHQTPGIITAAGGVLTQFLGATVLFLYRSNTTQGTQFVKALERINAVAMAWYIVDSLPEGSPAERRAKSQVKADAVRLIVAWDRNVPLTELSTPDSDGPSASDHDDAH